MKLTTTLLLLVSGAAGHVLADDPLTAAPTVRKQFRQSSSYPYVFKPDCYLATSGPAPLRFAPAAPSCGLRAAPPLTEAAKGKEKMPATMAPLPASEPATPAHPGAAYQPPGEGAHAEEANDAVDFKKMPEEVLEFFRGNDGKAGKRIYLFDPIFQPVKPNDQPKSKATYTQKP